jgi:RNA polymerase sigma-70 factor (ECF subfamily)
MLRIARKMAVDEDDASDIVQEVFIYYYEKLNKGLEVNHLKNWLIRAIVNKCVDYHKRKKKHTKLSVLNGIADKEQTVENQQSDDVLKEAFTKLKHKEMQLITLYSEGYSYKEIAQIAKINFSSVGKMLSRALQKLKIILEGMNYEMY